MRVFVSGVGPRAALLRLLAVLGAVSVPRGAADVPETAAGGAPGSTRAGAATPNIVILMADDLGIGDVGCYGNDTMRTPAIDRLAREGVRLTHHLAGAAVCTPSRAAFMTGRYAPRYGLVGCEGTPPVIVHIASTVGLPSSEPSLGRAFVAAGYRTHYTGKWHLGSQCSLWGRSCTGPLLHGFEATYWLPMTLQPANYGAHSFWVLPADLRDLQTACVSALAAAAIVLALAQRKLYRTALMIALLTACGLFVTWFMLTHYRVNTQRWHKVSPWMDQQLNGIVMNRTDVVEQPLDLERLNGRMTESSVAFLRSVQGTSKPFLLFHSFGHPHTPIISAPENSGKSRHGRYGDSVEELDQAVGHILRTMDELDMTATTIVYFLSDNGGQLEVLGEDGHRAGGHNGLFKGGKSMGGMEGGIRVPAIIRYPALLRGGQVLHMPTSMLDAMPTLLQLAGLPSVEELLPDTPLAKDLDGLSYAAALAGGTGWGQHEGRVLLHHAGGSIAAVRHLADGHVYKMFLLKPLFSPGSLQCGWGRLNTACTHWMGVQHSQDLRQHPQLYDLSRDPYEDHPIPANTSEYRRVVQHLQQYLEQWGARVRYAPPQFLTRRDTVMSLWLQPLSWQWSWRLLSSSNT